MRCPFSPKRSQKIAGVAASLYSSAKPDVGRALLQEILRLAGRRDAGKVALHVGGEDRDAGGGEALGENLQRNGLAGAGRAGDETVPVGEFQVQILRITEAVVGVPAGPEIDGAVLEQQSSPRMKRPL